MKSVLFSLIILLALVISSVVFVKTTTKFIKSTDPLAQQIFVLDNAKSPEVIKIKGELMRDLIRNYYYHQDSLKVKK